MFQPLQIDEAVVRVMSSVLILSYYNLNLQALHRTQSLELPLFN